MKKPFHIPLQAIALGVAIGLAIVGVAAKLVVGLHDDAWASARRANAEAAATGAHEAQRTLDAIDQVLQHVVDGLRMPAVTALPAELRERALLGSSGATAPTIRIVDAGGVVVLDTRERNARGTSVRGSELFRHHVEHVDAAPYFGRPQRADDGRERLTMSRRVDARDGTFAGFVVATVPLAQFRDLFAKIDLGAQSGLALLLDDGWTLARFPYRDTDTGRNVGGTDVFERIKATASGSFVARASVDGVERLYTPRRIGEYPVHLVAARSTATIAETWRGRAWLVAGVTFALLIGCGALAVILAIELDRRHRVEGRLFGESERLRVTLGSIGDAVVVTDDAGYVTYLNPVAERMTGWSTADAKHKHAHEVLHLTTTETSERVPSPVRIALAERRIVGLAADAVLHRRGGGTFAIEDSAAPILDRDGATIGAVMVFHDVSETRAMANRMSHLAQHDALTDLPNRVLMQDRLSQAIERGQRNGTQAALLFLDLDRFKHINDTLGHAAGDQLLVEVSRRLVGCVRESDTVSRLGGDEFVVLLSDLQDAQGPGRVAEKVLRALAAPFAIGGQSVVAGASIGIAIYPRDGTTVDQLTKNADAAMYVAKQSGRNLYRHFTDELDEATRRRLALEQDIAKGLRRDEFVAHWQPQRSLHDGSLVGVEALVRWKRGTRMSLPTEFMPLVEQSGLVVELGDRMLAAACRQAVAWQRRWTSPWTVSLDVAGQQLRAPDFVDRVARVLEVSGLEPRRLELGVGEAALAVAGDSAASTLRRLKSLGLRLALADFGVDPASLACMRRHPFDRIKLDRTLVGAIASDAAARAIVEAVVGLARRLGLPVVADGVETAGQVAVLEALGCAAIQGSCAGGPLAAEQVAFGRGAARDDGAPLLAA